MTFTDPEFHVVWEEIGDLKVSLRQLLDPERLHTPDDIRTAVAHAEAVIFKYWRKNLQPLGNDDGLAREYFSLFPLLGFLTIEAKRQSKTGPSRPDRGAI